MTLADSYRLYAERLQLLRPCGSVVPSRRFPSAPFHFFPVVNTSPTGPIQ